MGSIGIIILSSFTVAMLFRRSTSDGLAATVFCLVFMPPEIRIQTPGLLPEITVHRVILVVAACFTLREEGRDASDALALPGLGVLAFIAITRLISTLNGLTFSGGIKDLLSFLLESMFFYYLIAKGLTDERAVTKVVWAAGWALLCIAVIGWIEKYRGVNLAAWIVPELPDYGKSVTATFRHRILFGYAMAMGFPLFVTLNVLRSTRLQHIIVLGIFVLLPAACYFSNSRGPWVGLAVGAGVLTSLGSGSVRKKLLLLVAMGVVLVALRPGVADTVHNKWEQTFSTDTQKGRSASYRAELWTVAYRYVSSSPDRFLFGYGGQSLEHMQLGDQFEFGGGSSALGYTSWDSEYAADFMKFGAVGLFALILLHVVLVHAIWTSSKKSHPPRREFMVAGLATMSVFLWAMTNVAIFNPQLTFLFWVVVAVSVRCQSFAWNSEGVENTDGLEYAQVDHVTDAAPAYWLTEKAHVSDGIDP